MARAAADLGRELHLLHAEHQAAPPIRLNSCKLLRERCERMPKLIDRSRTMLRNGSTHFQGIGHLYSRFIVFAVEIASPPRRAS